MQSQATQSEGEDDRGLLFARTMHTVLARANTRNLLQVSDLGHGTD